LDNENESILEKTVVMSIEPSKEFSGLCGFPYFVQKRCTVRELLELGIINEQDIEEMEMGTIMKKVRVE
jgi:hypothetical protein